MVVDNKEGTIEADYLIKKQALEAKEKGTQSYSEWKGLTLTDTPLASLELRTEENYSRITKMIESFKDKEDLLNYKDDEIKGADGLTDRERAVAELNNTKIGDSTYLEISRKVDAIEKGTDENPTPDTLISAHLEYMNILDEPGRGSTSAEAMLYRVDNPDYNTWRMSESWGENTLDEIDQSQIPIWRIDVKYRDKDKEYNTIDPDAKNPKTGIRLRDEWLQLPENEDYRLDMERRDALTLTNSKTGYELPREYVENYVTYTEYGEKGKRKDRFLLENPEFAKALYDAGEIVHIPTVDEVPSVQYDDIYDQYKEQAISTSTPNPFDVVYGAGKPENIYYIEDAPKNPKTGMTPREETVYNLRFNKDGTLTDFGKAEIRRNAYEIYVPDKYVDRYVDYYSLLADGIPADWPKDKSGNRLSWYGDDWFLIEHPAFYENVYLGLLENEKIDFSKTPSREVFERYAQYVNLIEGQPRDEFRANEYQSHGKDFEEWLLLAKKITTPIWEKKRRSKLSPSEIRRLEMQERIKKIRT
jgi:hypothetical protein